ncbi:hypothetical protein FQN57_005866 [Myotisia sp. PD_48]|nr:hypothetical protein FQN57_005866 [Myotisia sp. PD_48]
MLRISHLFEASRCESSKSNMSSLQPACLIRSIPPSPESSQASSNPASPVNSLFSKSHNRFPSSVSSLASSPGMCGSTEAFGTAKTQLTEVKEEETYEREASLVEGDGYFPYFNDFHAAAAAATMDDSHLSLESHGYELAESVHTTSSIANRPSDNKSLRGISRISTRISSLSSRWKHKQPPISDAAAALERYAESLRSRANSATSALVSPAVSAKSGRQSLNTPSPARTTFEERLNEAGIPSIDVEKVNREYDDRAEPQARTPLLPPVMMDLPHIDKERVVNSPLESPSVADVSTSLSIHAPIGIRNDLLPSPLISAHPSMSSISRQLASSSRTHTTGDCTPIRIPISGDEWSSKLGHANFTIHPEPFLPEFCTRDSFDNFCSNWELARCNYGKHLARTGEHYGVTSSIYSLTEDKWDAINSLWKQHYDYLINNIEDDYGRPLTINPAEFLHRGDAVKIPGLQDREKFPDLGDEDIVGPMSVGPGLVQPGQTRDERFFSRRSILKLFHDLFSFRRS